MKLSRDLDGSFVAINAFSENSVTIGGREYQHSMMIMPSGVSQWEINVFEELAPGHIQALIMPETEIILLGTGRRQQFPAQDIYAVVAGTGIALEVMTTHAACRTYNILASEGRNLSVGLLLEV